jgi:hypothetical protein
VDNINRGRRWPAAVGAVALLAALTGCQPDDGTADGGPTKVCDMRVSKAPWLFRSTTRASDVEIRASVYVTCDRPPQSHRLEVWLERDVTASGNWLLQGPVVRDSLIPDAAGFERTARFVGCISSEWRVMARAAGVGPSGTPFRFDLPESETHPTAIQCPGPKR